MSLVSYVCRVIDKELNLPFPQQCSVNTTQLTMQLYVNGPTNRESRVVWDFYAQNVKIWKDSILVRQMALLYLRNIGGYPTSGCERNENINELIILNYIHTNNRKC